MTKKNVDGGQINGLILICIAANIKHVKEIKSGTQMFLSCSLRQNSVASNELESLHYCLHLLMISGFMQKPQLLFPLMALDADIN